MHGGALCVGVQGRSRQQPALSTSGTRDASVTHLPALTAGRLGSTFTLRTSNPRHASQTGRAFTPWLSAAAFLNVHGRAPGHSDSLGQGHQTGTVTRELALQFRCSLVVLLVYRRRFTHSNLVHVGGLFTSVVGLRPDAALRVGRRTRGLRLTVHVSLFDALRLGAPAPCHAASFVGMCETRREIKITC